jgi:hypothetical protein
MDLIELSKTIRADNASKGFDPTEGGVERYLLLTVSELCEAQDQLRDGYGINEIYYSGGFTDEDGVCYKGTKPEGFPVELADAIIRILDIQAKLELTIDRLNMDYNFPLENLESELLKTINFISSTSYSRTYSLNLALTRLLSIADDLGIDIEKVINEKLAYNRTRPAKHGRKF